MSGRYGDRDAEPTRGDTVEAKVTIKVGHSNGDFRHITVVDHLGRPIAEGSIPYRALREIREASHA